MKGSIKPIRYKCSRCDHKEEQSWVEFVIGVLNICLVILGLIFVLQLVFTGPYCVLDMVATKALVNDAGMDTMDLRELALRFTKFDGYDSFMFAEELATNIPRMRYVPTSKLDGLHDINMTWLLGGDCKHTSLLFSSMMMAVGYKANVDCSVKHGHCVTKIPHESGGLKFAEYMIVDLTTDEIKRFPNNVDHWEQPNEYTRYVKMQKDKWFNRKDYAKVVN